MRLPRLSPRWYAKVTFVALVAVCFIIVTGAAVRLTGSGLGCSQWPACENNKLVAPLELHPMIEFGNRMLTGFVSAAVILAVLGSLVRAPRRRDLTAWSMGLVFGVLLQIMIGGLAVKFELAPQFVTLHFLASIVLVWSGVVLHRRARIIDTVDDAANEAAAGSGSRAAALLPAEPVVAPAIVTGGRILLVLAIAVLVTGTLVTGTGPHAGDPSAGRYHFATISDIVRVHSIAVWVFLAATAVVLWMLKQTGAPKQVDQRARTLVFAIVVQGAIGYAQYITEVPPYLVIFHILGSVLVFIAALVFHLSLFTRPVARSRVADEQAPLATASSELVHPAP